MYKFTLLISLLLWTGYLFSQTPIETIHLDSLTKQEFLDIDQQRLSILKYKDSTVMLLRILSDNKFVEGLADSPEGFEVFFRSANSEDSACGKAQLTQISAEDDKKELNISVVLDYSGSMFFDRSYVTKMQKGAQSFIDNVKGAYFTRVNFDSYTDVINSTPTQTPRKIRYDNLNKYKKATALYDGIVDGVETLKGKRNNKWVVVFTDGLENSSGMSANTVIDVARKDSTKVIGISFGMAPEVQNLRDICEQTNHPDGNDKSFFSADNIDEVTETFLELEKGVFGNYYRITSICADTNFIPKNLIIKNLKTGDSVAIDVRNDLAKLREIDDNIFFGSIPFSASNSSINDPRYKRVIAEMADDIINHLIANPKDKIIIEGHASPDGEQDDNMYLSAERADNVYELIREYLRTKYRRNGKVADARQRISVKYCGDKTPIFPVTSTLNPENRRVSIVLEEG